MPRKKTAEDKTSTMEMKYCPDCGFAKPVSHFYKRSGYTNLYETLCIEHHKKKSARNQRKGSRPPKHERDLVQLLNSYGIPTHHGRTYKGKFNYVDIVCCGCVRVEIKKLQTTKDGYQVRFTRKQTQRGLLAEVVVLFHPTHKTYHFFSVNDPAFYHDDGNLKQGCTYMPDAPHRQDNVLTQTAMEEARNRFDLIKSAYQKWCVENNQYSL